MGSLIRIWNNQCVVLIAVIKAKATDGNSISAGIYSNFYFVCIYRIKIRHLKQSTIVEIHATVRAYQAPPEIELAFQNLSSFSGICNHLQRGMGE